MVIAVGTDHQFALLCQAIGAAELAADPRFATNTERVENRVALRAAIAERLMAAPAAEWGQELLAAGVPAGRVNDIAGALELAAQLGLAPTVTLPGPGGADVTLPANPIGHVGHAAALRVRPAGAGRHERRGGAGPGARRGAAVGDAGDRLSRAMHGRCRDRTSDLVLVRHVLYQLS